jgi:tetratricopeptide (TPR) repeat protein
VDRALSADLLTLDVRSRAARGAWGEVRSLLSAHEVEVRSRPELITLLGEAYLRTHAPREACGWLERTSAELKRSGDRAAWRKAVNLVGAARFELGDLDDAERAFHDALALGRAEGDDLVLARATNNLGLIANVRGRHAEALALYRMAIPSYQRLGQPRGLAETYHNLAITFRDLGDLKRAEKCERRALEYARQASDERLAAMAQVGLAELTLRQGDAELAEVTARRGAEAFARQGDVKGEADALRLAGVAGTLLGKYDAADAALRRAVALAAAQGYALVEGEARRAQAELALARGDGAGAREAAQAALALLERVQAARDAAALRAWMATHLPGSDR